MPKKPKSKSRYANKGRQVVKGITISPKNEATVAPELADVLFDLALKMEEEIGLAVDVQHVLAAVVMGSHAGEISTDSSLVDDQSQLMPVLKKYVRIVFANFGGKVGTDD